MHDGRNGIVVRTVKGIGEIPADQWDACAGRDNPFCSHAFLLALEASRSASAKSGWRPCHVVIEDPTGRVLACTPLYAKSHSYGEYVFDWAWADAWNRAGGRYYPKLQCAIPFTPVTGPRLLVRPGHEQLGLRETLADAMTQIAVQADLSSVHITFPTKEEAEALAARGWLLRMGEQYHWTNANYASFDDFLAALSSRKRKAIRKERERAQELDLSIHCLTGKAIEHRHWEAFYDFYLGTVEKKWANAYLTRDFFHRLGAALGDKVVLFMAEHNHRLVAGALNLRGDDTLYGRTWGAVGDFRFLHFEMCYYRAIDFAIEHGLKRVEAGAQGEHKVSRGYMPVPTWSVHWIQDPSLRRAVAGFLVEEREAVAASIQDLAEATPYRHGDSSGP